MQQQDDGKLHPVAYTSCSLSAAERNYGVSELETLAVVWALSRFHSYLYGQSVTVVTDHTAVRAILETPSPSCKHARWWTKVYCAGLKYIKIVYRAGRLNQSADALSLSPCEGPTLEGVTEQELQLSSVQSHLPMTRTSAQGHLKLSQTLCHCQYDRPTVKGLQLSSRRIPT